MMKKHRIFLIIFFLLVLLGGLYWGFSSIYKKGTENNNVIEKKVGIYNIKEYDGEVPDFELNIDCNSKFTLLSASVKKNKIPIYEFDGVIKNDWETVENHYLGFRLKDLLAILFFNSLSHVIFESENSLEILYNKDKITDDTFLIIYRDGKYIDDKVLSLIDFSKDYRFAVENIKSINVIDYSPLQ